jgi:hypothetical protein
VYLQYNLGDLLEILSHNKETHKRDSIDFSNFFLNFDLHNMAQQEPSMVQLVLQYLHENGFENTLKEFEAETYVI